MLRPSYNKICPCCCQEILLPEELRALQLTGAQMLMLNNLYKSRPNLVPLHRFTWLKPKSVKVLVHHIKRAFVEAGVSDWEIKTCTELLPHEKYKGGTHQTIGYSLEQRSLKPVEGLTITSSLPSV